MSADMVTDKSKPHKDEDILAGADSEMPQDAPKPEASKPIQKPPKKTATKKLVQIKKK